MSSLISVNFRRKEKETEITS